MFFDKLVTQLVPIPVIASEGCTWTLALFVAAFTGVGLAAAIPTGD